MNTRNSELAKIHIGKKNLNMDQQTYQDMLWTQARVTSSADLDEHGRHKVIKHMENCGVVFTKRKPKTSQAGNASASQVSKIKALWANLAAANVVKDASEAGLRKWLQNTTRSHHERRFGWTAPQFLPSHVAIIVIEQLKQWCKRTGVNY